MTFEPITIKTCLAPKNDSLSLSLVNNIYHISANTFGLKYCFLWEMWKFSSSFHMMSIFLLHKLNSYENYQRGETIQGSKQFAEIWYAVFKKWPFVSHKFDASPSKSKIFDLQYQRELKA